jgi:acetolactate synthase small subunit
MTDEPTVDRWIFLLQVKSRPGALSAVTAIFADRSVSIETITAHDSSCTGAVSGTVLLTFAASAAKKNYLARVLSRSVMVEEVVQYRYDDAAHARKSVLVRAALEADRLAGSLPPGLLCDIISTKPGETLALLLGPPPLVDEALAALTARAATEAADPTILLV